MGIWAKLRGITKAMAINRSWLETQDDRLERLEREYRAMREEATQIRRYYENQRWAGDQ